MLTEILAMVFLLAASLCFVMWQHERGKSKHLAERKEHWFNRYEAVNHEIWQLKYQIISQEGEATRERTRANALESNDKRLKDLQAYLGRLPNSLMDRQIVVCDEIERLMKVGE